MYRLHMMPMNIDAENASVFAARLNREVALIGRSRLCADAVL